MAVTPLSEYNLQDLFAKKITYPEKKKIVIESESLELHQEGRVPTAMLNETRPGESLEAKAYRKKIFKSKTKNIFNRVLQSLSKIERSVDFSCYFNDKDVSKKIAKGETPKDYLTINYPYGSGNFIHYVFAELINVYVTEPMGLVLIAIDENDLSLQSNEYVKPKPIVFESKDILHFASDLSWAILEADNCATYYNEGAKKTDGRVIYVVDSNVLQRYEQINSSGEMALKFEYKDRKSTRLNSSH